VDGEVYLMAAVTDEHTWITQFLIGTLTNYAEQKKIGVVKSDPFQMKLSAVRAGRQPDVMFIEKSRAHLVTRLYLDGPSNVAIEVISDNSRRIDRVVKFQEYEAGGVGEYWLIDPDIKAVEFYQRSSSGLFEQVLVGSDGIYHSREMQDLWIQTHWLWSHPAQFEVFKAWKLM